MPQQPSVLATFKIQLLMVGNMADTSRDNLFLKFHYPLSLDGTREYILMTSKEETRILRFASNPKVRVGLIMRESLEIYFPLNMISHKGGKSPQLNITWKRNRIQMAGQRTSHLMQIQLTQQILVLKVSFQKCFEEFSWDRYFIWSPFFYNP